MGARTPRRRAPELARGARSRQRTMLAWSAEKPKPPEPSRDPRGCRRRRPRARRARRRRASRGGSASSTSSPAPCSPTTPCCATRSRAPRRRADERRDRVRAATTPLAALEPQRAAGRVGPPPTGMIRGMSLPDGAREELTALLGDRFATSPSILNLHARDESRFAPARARGRRLRGEHRGGGRDRPDRRRRTACRWSRGGRARSLEGHTLPVDGRRDRRPLGHGPRAGGQPGRPRLPRPGRHPPPRAGGEAGRRGPVLRRRPRRRRHARRHGRHRGVRHPHHPLRHDARERARPRGGARRRLGRAHRHRARASPRPATTSRGCCSARRARSGSSPS